MITNDNLKQIQDWHQLLNDGTITNEEFNNLKASLLNTKIITPTETNEVVDQSVPYNFNKDSTNKPIYLENKKRNKLLWLWISLPILFVIGGGFIYYNYYYKNKLDDKNINATVNNSKNEINEGTPQPTTSTSTTTSIFKQFAGYYRGGMQSGYVGGTDNAECTVNADGSASFHYILNTGNKNNTVTEYGYLSEENGKLYFNEIKYKGKYNVYFTNTKLLITGSNWHAEMFLNGTKPIEIKNGDIQDKTTNYKNTETTQNSNYESNIKAFLVAEEKRDFDLIYSYLSPNIEWYFDLHYPTKENLQKRYLHLWDITATSKNSIISIEKIATNSYDVTSDFEYFGLKTQTTTVRRDKSRFIFNNEGQIVAIYN